MRFSVNPLFPKVWITFVTKIVVAVYPWTGSCVDIVRRFMLKWQLSVSSCVYTVKLIPNTFKHWFKKMKRQQTNLRSSPDSEAIGIKHTMVRRGTIVHKINELPCCRFHHIKWGCLLQNKKHKTFFFDKNFTFYIWKIQDKIYIQERHPMRNTYMYNNTLHLEELQQCYYNFLQNWDC